MENACIITEKPTSEQEAKMNKRLLDFKQTKPVYDRIVDALFDLKLPSSDASKVLEFVSQSKKTLGGDQELREFINNLVSMGLIDGKL